MRDARRRAALAVVCLLCLTAPAGAAETSEQYADSTYREREGGYTVIVGSYQASMNAGYPYVPLLVAVGLNRKGPPVSFTPDSFTLIDGEGNEIPAAEYGELLRGYGKLGFDAAWVERKPLQVGRQFEAYQRVTASFYPPTDDGVRTRRVSLSRRTWFSDVLYFPAPPEGFGGVLTLRVQGEGMETPIAVRFGLGAAE